MSDLERQLEKFVCQRCHECCRQPGYVYLGEEEIKECAAYLKQDPFDFVNEYCELLDKRKVVLKKHIDESCIFLSDSGCRIHSAKPKQCVEFPLKWRTPKSFDYCEGMKKIGLKG